MEKIEEIKEIISLYPFDMDVEVLEFIEAQQKEIERLKDENKSLNSNVFAIEYLKQKIKIAQLKKQVEELSNVLIDIDNTLFHHNYSVDGYHLNGEKEPIMNFVADFDMNVIRDKQQLNK